MKTNMKRAAFVVALSALAVGLTLAPRLIPTAEASPASAFRAQTSVLVAGVTIPSGPVLDLRLVSPPNYLGTIDATTTSKTNAQATTTFNTTGDLLKGRVLLVQNAGTVSIRVLAVATSTGVVSNTRGADFGPEIQPGERITIVSGTNGYLAGITTSSTANIDVWELK